MDIAVLLISLFNLVCVLVCIYLILDEIKHSCIIRKTLRRLEQQLEEKEKPDLDEFRNIRGLYTNRTPRIK
jgi:hypothetical protein